MLETDAYDHAQSVFGQDAGVWRAGPDRCIAGRWLPIGELDEETSSVVLRTPRQALLVLGEGATWALAFADAEARRRRALPALLETSRAAHFAEGDEFAPSLAAQ